MGSLSNSYNTPTGNQRHCQPTRLVRKAAPPRLGMEGAATTGGSVGEGQPLVLQWAVSSCCLDSCGCPSSVVVLWTGVHLALPSLVSSCLDSCGCPSIVVLWRGGPLGHYLHLVLSSLVLVLLLERRIPGGQAALHLCYSASSCQILRPLLYFEGYVCKSSSSSNLVHLHSCSSFFILLMSHWCPNWFNLEAVRSSPNLVHLHFLIFFLRVIDVLLICSILMRSLHLQPSSYLCSSHPLFRYGCNVFGFTVHFNTKSIEEDQWFSLIYS